MDIPTIIPILTTAPAIIAGYEAQLDEIQQQRRGLSDYLWDPIEEACEIELDRLEEADPPMLMRCILGNLGCEGGPLQGIRSLQVRREQIDVELERIASEVEELWQWAQYGDSLQAETEHFAAYVSWSERFASPFTHCHFPFQTKYTLLYAEKCEIVVAIRREEGQIWEKGDMILSPVEDAIHYETALASDPQFAELCDDYTRLAARYREKHVVEQQILKLYRQALAIEERLEKVEAEYERIYAEEEEDAIGE